MDAAVTGAGVDLAVREFGGNGTPALMLHGAGNTLVDMAPLASYLVSDHRVVAIDLRNHGRSGDGPWGWDDVLADIRAAIDGLEMANPILIGHSLGGMLAAMYADRYGDIAAAINLDGHTIGPPPDDEIEAARWSHLRELLRTLGDQTIREIDRPRTELEVAAGRDMWVAGARALGLEPTLATEAFDRKLAAHGDGTFTTRPALERLMQMRDALEELDLLACYRRASLPQLVYVAVREQQDPRLPEELHALNAAHRQRQIEALHEIAAHNPNLRLIELDATHGLIYECPELIADQIRDFAAHPPTQSAARAAASMEPG